MNRSATAVYHRINKPQWSHAVILVVIPLSGEPSINCEILTFELLAMDVINGWLNKTN